MSYRRFFIWKDQFFAGKYLNDVAAARELHEIGSSQNKFVRVPPYSLYAWKMNFSSVWSFYLQPIRRVLFYKVKNNECNENGKIRKNLNSIVMVSIFQVREEEMSLIRSTKESLGR